MQKKTRIILFPVLGVALLAALIGALRSQGNSAKRTKKRMCRPKM